jgi:hypothetical protein
VTRIFKILSSSYFEAVSTVLLTTVTLLCNGTPELLYGYNWYQFFDQTLPIFSPLPTAVPGHHCSTFFLYETISLGFTYE